MKVNHALIRFGLLVVTLVVPACAPRLSQSPPISIVSPSPSKPHIILSADRSVVRHGETVQMIVTFVNPTGKAITVPYGYVGEDGYGRIEHRLEVDWERGDGDASSLGGHWVSIMPNPPQIHELAPGESKSYRLRWKFDDRGEGRAILKYKFGWGDVFQPVEITLHTK